LPPRLVVEVLAPARGVDPGGLDVAVRERADPHLGPGRRDRESGDARPRLGIDRVAVGVAIREPAPAATASDARRRGVRSSEPWHAPNVRPGRRSRQWADSPGMQKGPRPKSWAPQAGTRCLREN